jgi:hypothetical protein
MNRRALRVLLLVCLAILLIWLVLPATQGFHIGYNTWTDHECLTRLIQWCK